MGRGSFVSAQNKDFYQEEQRRQAEEHLRQAADIGRTSGIPVEKLVELLCGSSTRIRRFDVWTETRWWSMD